MCHVTKSGTFPTNTLKHCLVFSQTLHAQQQIARVRKTVKGTYAWTTPPPPSKECRTAWEGAVQMLPLSRVWVVWVISMGSVPAHREPPDRALKNTGYKSARSSSPLMYQPLQEEFSAVCHPHTEAVAVNGLYVCVHICVCACVSLWGCVGKGR